MTKKESEFHILRNLVTAKIRHAKRRYLLRQFTVSKYNGRMTWKIANELVGRSKQINIEDTVKKNFPNQSTQEICDKFNDIFIRATGILKEMTATRTSTNQFAHSHTRLFYLL